MIALYPHRRQAWGLLLIALTLSVSVVAEDLIESRRGEFQRQDEQREYNLKISALELDLRGDFRVTYDDNNNRGTTPESDIDATTAEYGLGLNAFWPLTPDFQAVADLFIGYESVLDGDNGSEGLVLRAGQVGALGMDIRVGDNGFISIYDRVAASVETIAANEAENTEDLRMLRNDLRAQYEATISPYYSVLAAVGREDHLALDDEFDARDRVVYYGQAALEWRPNRDLTTGPYISYNKHNWDEPVNNDLRDYSIGWRLRYKIQEGLAVDAELGYQGIDVDADANPTATAESDGPRGKVALISEPTRYFRHGIELRHQRNPHTAAGINYSEDTAAVYNLHWDVTDEIFTELQSGWTHSREAGDNGETADIYTNRVTFGYRLTERATVTTSYRRTDKDSDLPDLRYDRNEFSLRLEYDF